MNKSLIKFLTVGLLIIFVYACQRDLRFPQFPAAGSLQEDGNGACLPKLIAGTYIKGKDLADTNYIEVTVHVTDAGSYTITSDTINEYSFRASGNFADTGLQVVRLIGTGKPAKQGNDRFNIRFNNSNCLFVVNVLDN